jgi:AraC-like DNA-binding protein
MDSKIPSAASIRRRLCSILQDEILFDLRAKATPCMLSAQLPLRVPEGITLRELEIAPLTESAANDIYPTGLQWDEHGVHAIQFPVLCCVFAGEIDLRIGVTETMLKHTARSRRQCGGYIIALPSPCYFIIPAGVPYPTGTLFPWERPEPERASAQILWLRVLPTGALCHTTLIQGGAQKPQYSLLVEDELLAPMMEILLTALHPSKGHPEIAQAQLLVLFLRLQHDLQSSAPMMTDGLHSRFPDVQTIKPQLSPELAKACEYIQLHLHEALTPDDIASHLRMKPAQLNRKFRKQFQTSVMRYVTRQRIETARLLLQSSELSVQEISRLVGYKYSPHFTRLFAEHEGVSPLKYRQHQAHAYHSEHRKL